MRGALQPQFRNAHVSVTVARLRTVRIYVVGDVQRPGAYDVSSLAIAAERAVCSGRADGGWFVASAAAYRGKKKSSARLISTIFCCMACISEDDRLEGGDTLLVPPAGPQVAVYGAVKRPAIYELMERRRLAAVLEDAGGATVAAALGHITVERIDAHQHAKR